jgi:hypothetical protein
VKSKTEIIKVQAKYDRIFVIVSPPRCASTALARMFWEQPSIRYYCHEPFEAVYYDQQPISDAFIRLKSPIDLEELYPGKTPARGNSLIIKEMPYQVGDNFPILAKLTRSPIIFLLRDPRLNISSRIEKKVIGGQPPVFPLKETGWELILGQIDYCKRNNIPFIILDSEDFRKNPRSIFKQLFQKLDLPYSDKMLEWRVADIINLDNLNGKHHHLYERVLKSKSIEPPLERVPKIWEFPVKNGMREHVKKCLNIYQSLLTREERILVR